MSLARKIILNTAVNVAGQGASYLVGAISMMLIMRYLGPEQFGIYSLVMVYVAVISAVGDMGGQMVLVREVNQRPTESPRIIGNFLMLKLVLYFLAFVLGLAFTWILGYSGDLRIWLALGLSAMFFSFPLSGGAVFQARLNIWYGVVINLVAKAITLGVVLLVIRLNKGLALILWGNIAVSLLSAVACWGFIHKMEKPVYHPDWKFISELLSQSAPLGLLWLAGEIVFRSGIVMLSKLSDPISLGVYTAAFKYMEWGLLVTAGILVTHLPVFSQYLASEPEKVRKFFKTSFNIVGLLLIPVSIFVVFNADALIRIISGPAYVPGAKALTVLIWVVLFGSWNTITVNLLVANHKVKALLLLYFPVMAVNLAINYFGIPRYGYMICAASSLLNEILVMAPLLIMIKRWYDLKPEWLGAVKQTLISLAAAIPMILLPTGHIVGRSAAFAATWLLLGLITNIPDIRRLRNVLINRQG